MSRTTMYAAPEGGTFRQVAEFSNSYGSAMYVWAALGKKYFGDEYFVMSRSEEFWPLWKDSCPSESERTVLLFTFDKCLVKATDAPRLASAFRRFVGEHPPVGVVCTLPAQAEVLDAIATLPLDFVPYAIGWRQTSVTNNRWGWRHTGPGEDDGTEYNLSADSDHFWLFDELDEFVRSGSRDRVL
jgi:hypothetical protein